LVVAYTAAELSRELRQSEIITNLYQFTYDVIAREAVQTLHTYAIVLSQDCDLLWDFEAKIGNGRRDLNGVWFMKPNPLLTFGQGYPEVIS
jgi:hypothetical protein